MIEGAETAGGTVSAPVDPCLELLKLFPDGDAKFRAAVRRIVVDLVARPPFLLDVFTDTARRLVRRPKQFLELHAAQLLGPLERRRLEPRLWSRRQAYILAIGALLIHMDLPSLRCGKRVAADRIFGVGQLAIQRTTGMSLSRIRNAIGDLVDAGYLTWTQPIARYTKRGAPGRLGFAAWNAIYRFEVKFFERLHLDRKLARARKRAAERRANRVRLYAASLVRVRAAHGRTQRSLRARSVGLFGEPTQGAPYRPPRPPKPKP